MKVRNLKINESIEKQFEHSLENEHTVLEPTEANALEMEKERKKQIEDDFKEQDKVADEVAKATNATEVNEPKKVADRKELSKLLAEAKEAGKQFRISRCNEEGYRYLFETFDKETDKEILTEAKEEEKLPETFDEQMDFLAADEQEAIDGYEKIIAVVDDEHVKEQLDKILIEERAHKEFLEAVKADHSLVYSHEESEEEAPVEEVSEVEEVVTPVEECKESLTEADEPAAESMENCQKWVDYDMEHYGVVSDNTREIVEKAGFQIIKDDHGDYEVAAGKFESLKEDYYIVTHGDTGDVMEEFDSVEEAVNWRDAHKDEGAFGINKVSDDGEELEMVDEEGNLILEQKLTEESNWDKIMKALNSLEANKVEESCSKKEELEDEECEECSEEEFDDEKPFEEEKVEYEVDDDFDWKI